MKKFSLTLATAILVASFIGTWPSAAQQANTPNLGTRSANLVLIPGTHEGTRNNGADRISAAVCTPFRRSL